MRLEYKNRLPTTLVDDVNRCAAAECGKHIARGDEVGAQNQRNPICFLDVADIFAFGGGEYEHVGRGFLIVKALGNPEIAVVVDVDVHNAVVAGASLVEGAVVGVNSLDQFSVFDDEYSGNAVGDVIHVRVVGVDGEGCSAAGHQRSVVLLLYREICGMYCRGRIEGSRLHIAHISVFNHACAGDIVVGIVGICGIVGKTYIEQE